MKRHVFAATALLFLVTLACRNRTPMKTYDAAATPVATIAPVASAPTSNEAEDNEIVTKKMKMIETIAAMKLPPISSTSTLKPKGPKPKLGGFDYPATAAVVDAKTIPAFPKDHQLEAFETTALFACARLARGTVTTIDDLPRRECKGFRYLVVMRFLTRVNPKMTGPTTFQGGHANGDATVFDLDTGERLGAVPFNAINYDKLEALQGVELGRAIADLEGQCATIVNDEINKAWPSQ
jgi:hypothetical protein